ncbi:M56 family metallopeptidase [Paenibacillus sp. YN15]|uniref:M56 family metallopeptidase n=1 Tax=Paenibacillus sp. YN15 TaxID=1742774 RepID=UPI0011BDB5E5|nr:M56 family metallopeptidase [Paenibacillus sp. YN15]
MAVVILQMSLLASVLIVTLLILRALAIHRLPKKAFLVLWGIALCRLLIPFSVPSRFSIYNLFNWLKGMFTGAGSAPAATPNPGTASYAATASAEGAVPDIVNPVFAEPSSAGLSVWAVIWLIGLAACAWFILAPHLRRRRDYKSALPVDNEIVNRWLREHTAKRTVQIRQSDKIASPLTYGIWKPVILLPKTMDWTNEQTLLYVLTHEYIHIKRLDILYKWLLAAALFLHWFNPLVWIMYIMANRDIEISCDEAVVRTYGERNKSSYALTLIELEEKKSALTPLFSNFSKNAVEERIVAIMKRKKTTVLSLLVALAFITGATFVFATSAEKPKEVGMFAKALGNEAYKYAENINKPSDEAARLVAEDYTLYIDSTIFTDHHVYAIIGAEGNLPEDLSISGKIVYAGHVQDLYGLNGTIEEIEARDGVRYFFYSAVITELQTEQNKAIDPMLALAAGDSYKRSSLRDWEGENLELTLGLDNREHILKATVANVSTNALIFYPDGDLYKGDYYSKVVLTPWEIKFSGHSDKTYASYEEWDKALNIKLTIVLSGGKKINMSYSGNRNSSEEDYPTGMSRGANMDTGDFYHWWNFRNWELDLGEVRSIILDGKTYRPVK